MAQQISGKSVQRAPIKPRRQFLPEASAAAQATGEILRDRFGAQPWIDQVMAAVQNAVQLGIENLSGTSISVNSHPGDSYRFGARSAEELKASAHLVPGVNQAELPPPEESAVTVPRATPRPTPPKAPAGWIL